MYRCIGCNTNFTWEGKGIYCPCGGHVFFNDENKSFSFPSSYIQAVHDKRELPHLDYLIGNSEHTSEMKETLTELFKAQGAIWGKDCDECRGKKPANFIAKMA